MSDRSGPDLSPLDEFAAVMRQLRAECPWKREQTHTSLVRYLLEETHETVEAIESGNAAHLREELGDLLLQVFFHAAIAEEAGAFTLDEVAAGITAKMRHRNPHVFGDAPVGHPSDINEQWEQLKAKEKQRTTVTEGLPPSLPALLYADKVLDRVGRAGHTFAPDSQGELGDRLLALVAEAHASGSDPEQALRDAVRRLVQNTSTSQAAGAELPGSPPVDRPGDTSPTPGLG